MLKYLKEQLERTNYWLAFSETKNAVLIAFNVAALTVVEKILSGNIWICAISYTLLFVSTFICLVSFIPCMSNNEKLVEDAQKKEKEEYNLVYYGDIAKLDKETYIEKVKNRYNLHTIEWEQEICDDIAKEIIENSKIAVRKYNLFKYAVLTDIVCIIFLVLVIIIA